MNCPDPHPVRGEHGRPHASLAVVGAHASACWARCRQCGRWFWLETDQGRFGYREERELDGAQAEAALTGRGDPSAIVALLAAHGLPHGPLWELPEARAKLLAAMTPASSRRDRIHALRAASLDATWTRVLAQLEALESARARAARMPALAFALDLRGDFAVCSGPYEIDGAVFLLRRAAPCAALRITPEAVVEIPLGGTPTVVGGRADTLMVHVSAASGREGIVAFRTDAMIPAKLGAAPGPLAADALDDGAWMLHRIDMSTHVVELRDRDLVHLATLRIARQHHESEPPLLRRVGDGWLASNVLTRDDQVLALARLDDRFHVVAAASSEHRGARHDLTPLGEGIVATRNVRDHSVLELWHQRDTELVLANRLAARSSVAYDAGLVVLDPEGQVRAVTPAGHVRWSCDGLGRGAYMHRIGEHVVVYRGSQALVITIDDGTVLHRVAEPFHLSLAADRHGGGYLLAGPGLLCLRGGALARTEFDRPYQFATTAAGAIVLADPDDTRRYVVCGSDGALHGEFHTPSAQFSVIGTRGGPYVLEPDRLRIGGFAR